MGMILLSMAREGDRLEQIDLPWVQLFSGRQLLPLDQVSPHTGGGKAYGARRLEELPRSGEAGFKTPP